MGHLLLCVSVLEANLSLNGCDALFRYVEIFLASSAQIRDAQEFFPDEREPPKFRDYSPEPTSRGGPPAYHGGGGGYYDQYPPVDGYYDRRTDEYGPPRPKGALSRYDPYGVGREFRLYMRGLPWICSEEDIGKVSTRRRHMSVLWLCFTYRRLFNIVYYGILYHVTVYYGSYAS